ncbi:UPF0158 family protein [Chungangia koreensis]|uniref:UPF0158 family protein n=1 Tax=Chungangia koreensis TaxID=752657 RepID=A0ABV8X015_9LACT
MKLIDELAEVLLMTDREFEQYLNKDTGEIFFKTDDEDEEMDDRLALIPQISSPEAFDLMVSFANEQSEDHAFVLKDILNQPRPFAKFKDKVYELGIQNEWFAFEDGYAKQRMLDWLFEIGVSTNIRENLEGGH